MKEQCGDTWNDGIVMQIDTDEWDTEVVMCPCLPALDTPSSLENTFRGHFVYTR